MDKNFRADLVKATINEYPIIQNMARFYVYDLSRYCGFISDEWACPPDGLFTDVDLKHYFIEPTREAYLIKINNELVGFALLHLIELSEESYWTLAEFFIVAKFQDRGIGAQIVKKLWKLHAGKWEVPIIPENTKALNFWRAVISNFTNGLYKEEIRKIDYDKNQPKRIILSFDEKNLLEKT